MSSDFFRMKLLSFLAALGALIAAAILMIGRGPDWARRPPNDAAGQEAADTFSPPLRVARPGLLAQAKVPPAQAWRTARASIGEEEPLWGVLEPLSGHLVYVLLFRNQQERIDELIVDANTGVLLSTRHQP